MFWIALAAVYAALAFLTPLGSLWLYAVLSPRGLPQLVAWTLVVLPIGVGLVQLARRVSQLRRGGRQFTRRGD